MVIAPTPSLLESKAKPSENGKSLLPLVSNCSLKSNWNPSPCLSLLETIISCSSMDWFGLIQAVMEKSPSAKCSSGKALEVIWITSPLPSNKIELPTTEPVDCAPKSLDEPDILLGGPMNEPELPFPELSKHNVPSSSSKAQ